MDEDLDSLAQRYAVKRNIKRGERLGFGIHGTVFAAEDNTKPGFFAVKFHREERPFERECRVYQRLREEQTTRIRGFNVPQLLKLDEEFRAIEMTIVRIYYWAVDREIILMLLIYGKNEQDDLTAEQLRVLKGLVEEEFK